MANIPSQYYYGSVANSAPAAFRDLADNGYRSEVRYRSGAIYPLAFRDIELDVQRFLS